MIGPIVLILRVMLALALYAFLALVLWMLWRDIKQAGLRAGSRQVPSISLRIHTKKPQAHYRHFSQTKVTLGRDPSCDVRLSNKSISAHHARLVFERDRWWLEGLDSKHATWLNRKRLTGRAVLAVGDEIKCGQLRVVISSLAGAVQFAMSGAENRDG